MYNRYIRTDDGTYTKILQHWGVESGALDKAEINPAVE